MEINSSLIFFLAVLTLLVFAKLYLPIYQKKRRMDKLVSNVPGPSAFPFVGSVQVGFGDISDLLAVFKKLRNNYKDSYKFWLGNELIVNTVDAEDCNKILSSRNALGKADLLYGLAKKLAKDGLPIASEEIWRRHRKVLIHMFKNSLLKDHLPIYNKYCVNAIKALDVFDEEDKNSNYADIFYKALFGIAFETLVGKDVSDDLQSASISCQLDRILDITEMRILKPWLISDVIFKLTSVSKEQEILLLKARNFCNEILQERKLELSNNSSSELTSIIDPLIKCLDCPDEEIIDEMMTITTAEKVYREIIDVVGETDEIKYDHLQDLTYTEMVIKESLRLFPTAPIIAREPREDIELKSFVLPAGSTFIVNIFDIHRNEKYWPNPNSFIPERFSPENQLKHDPHAYIPFSLGPRMCIGYKAAMMALTVFVAHIVRNYQITSSYKSVDDIKTCFHLTLAPAEGTNCKLKVRSGRMA